MAVVGQVGAGQEGEAVAVGLGGDVAQELEGIADGLGAGEFQGEDDEAAGCEVGGEAEDGFHGFVRRLAAKTAAFGFAQVGAVAPAAEAKGCTEFVDRVVCVVHLGDHLEGWRGSWATMAIAFYKMSH